LTVYFKTFNVHLLVFVVTRPRMDDRGIVVWFLAGVWNFSLRWKHPNWFWGLPNISLKGYQGLLL